MPDGAAARAIAAVGAPPPARTLAPPARTRHAAGAFLSAAPHAPGGPGDQAGSGRESPKAGMRFARSDSHARRG